MPRGCDSALSAVCHLKRVVPVWTRAHGTPVRRIAQWSERSVVRRVERCAAGHGRAHAGRTHPGVAEQLIDETPPPDQTSQLHAQTPRSPSHTNPCPRVRRGIEQNARSTRRRSATAMTARKANDTNLYTRRLSRAARRSSLSAASSCRDRGETSGAHPCGDRGAGPGLGWKGLGWEGERTLACSSLSGVDDVVELLHLVRHQATLVRGRVQERAIQA